MLKYITPLIYYSRYIRTCGSRRMKSKTIFSINDSTIKDTKDEEIIKSRPLTEEERQILINDGLDNQDYQWEPGHGPLVQADIPRLKDFYSGAKQMKIETKKLWDEYVEDRKSPRESFVDPDTIYKVFTFEKENSVANWSFTCDKEQEVGQSTCSLTRTHSGTLLFTGNICTDIPADGKTFRTGFAAFRTPRIYLAFLRRGYYDWSLYNHLVIKLRGDGRHYNVNLGQDEEFQPTWYDMHSYFIFTRGGPYWETIKVPFSKFVSTRRGYVRDNQIDFKPEEVTFLGLTLQDGVSGPFSLEIEYIGVQYNLRHTEENAYEDYDVQKIWDKATW